MQHVLPLSPRTAAFLFYVRLAAEIAAGVFLYMYFLQSPPMENHLVMVIIFVILLLSLAAENSPTGKLFNRKFWGSFGKYAYSIYAMQEIGFLLLKKTVWNWTPLLSNVALTLTGSVLFCTLLGIAVYYLVEKPCTEFYTRWYRNYLQALEAGKRL